MNFCKLAAILYNLNFMSLHFYVNNPQQNKKVRTLGALSCTTEVSGNFDITDLVCARERYI